MRKIPFAAYLFFFFFLPAACVQAAVIYVPGNFKTIQDAVNSASPDDTVIIREGTYSENIVIKKTVTLKSAIAHGAVIRAAVKKEPSVKIENTSGAGVIGLTLTGSDNAGIFLYNASGSRIEGNMAVNNNSGIVLDHSSNNTLIGNNANSNSSYGIYLLRSNNNLIEKNTANSNEDKGVFISYSDNNRITDNSANLNAWNGMMLWASHNNELKDNLTLRNTYGIVMNDAEGNNLAGNTTLPNIFLILPIVLIYIGVISYLVQKNIMRFIYRV